MRIGDFSKKHNVSIDTIRHYIDMGLLLPSKDGAHYSFGEECSCDIEEIKRLKQLRFSLTEIQKLLIARRVTNLEEDENREYFNSFFLDKKNSLIKERDQINEMLAELEYRIQTQSIQGEKGARKLGVPLLALSILHCPNCRGALKLSSTHLDDNMVIDGKLSCQCGFCAQIDDGIIILEAANKPVFNESLKITVQKYMESTAPEYLNFMYRTIEWIARRADLASAKSNIILEPGTGSGFLLKQINGLLEEETLYISVDHNIEMIRSVKSYLEAYSKHTGFVFICCDFSEIPIRDNTIDTVIDFYGSTNYNFRESNFLMDLLDSKVKQQGSWYGVYFCLDRNSKTVLQYPAECRPYFYRNSLIEKFRQSSFKELASDDFGVVNRAGEFEPFFIEGDNLYAIAYCGRKI